MHTDFELSMSAQDAFTFGDCWRLAKALYNITGWQIAAVVCENQDCQGDKRDWCHMGNITPEGDFIDISGISSQEYTLGEWGHEFWMHCEEIEDEECIAILPITVEQWEGMTEEQEPRYEEEDPETAAQEVLAAYVAYSLAQKSPAGAVA